MYSRNYYPDGGESVTLPDNYDGTAFQEQTENQTLYTEEKESESVSVGLGSSSLLSGILGKGNFLEGLGLKMPKIGTEEILILATAAFLFFSKNGDRESALILLLLLFIS